MTIDRIYDEAAAWLVRQDDDAMEWEAFTAWLESDPRNRDAYDELALIDARIKEHSQELRRIGSRPQPLEANDSAPVRWPRWFGLAGVAAAAALALSIGLQPPRPNLPARDYRSAPGQMIQVALGGGATALLAPASHLRVSGQTLVLEGTGYFTVPHLRGRKLSISAGDFIVTDIGTSFSVANETGGVSVDVAEGQLEVTSARLSHPIGLSAGHGLRAKVSLGTVTLVQVSPRQVASWRTGKLEFDQVPLELVARDISRYSGAKITVDPAIAKQPFSGVIAVDHGEAPARTLAQILSLDLKAVDGTVRLVPRGH